MTIQQIDNFKIKGKRKEHPMARKYPGRPCIEIGTALRKFYDDLDEDEAKLLIAIVDAVKPVDKNIVQNKYNLDDIKDDISVIKDIKGIICFIPDISSLELPVPFVQAPSLKKMISDTESKMVLWKKLKEIFLK